MIRRTNRTAALFMACTFADSLGSCRSRRRNECLAPAALVGRSIVATGAPEVTAMHAADRMPEEIDYEGFLAAANTVARVRENHLADLSRRGCPRIQRARGAPGRT